MADILRRTLQETAVEANARPYGKQMRVVPSNPWPSACACALESGWSRADWVPGSLSANQTAYKLSCLTLLLTRPYVNTTTPTATTTAEGTEVGRSGDSSSDSDGSTGVHVPSGEGQGSKGRVLSDQPALCGRRSQLTICRTLGRVGRFVEMLDLLACLLVSTVRYRSRHHPFGYPPSSPAGRTDREAADSFRAATGIVKQPTNERTSRHYPHHHERPTDGPSTSTTATSLTAAATTTTAS